MSETMLGVDGNYVRVVRKTIQAYAGMGITRVMFTLEIGNKDQGSQGYPTWMGGRAEVQAPGGTRQHIGHLHASTAQPVSVGRFGHETSVQLTLDLTDRQFWLLDENRTGGALRIFLTFSGHVIIENRHVALQDTNQLVIDLSQSEWLDLIRTAGLRRKILLELDAPD